MRTKRPVGRHRTTGLVLAAIVLFAGCGGGSSDAGAAGDAAVLDGTALGTVATADGGQLSFGDLEGKPALLWFWAPW